MYEALSTLQAETTLPTILATPTHFSLKKLNIDNMSSLTLSASHKYDNKKV